MRYSTIQYKPDFAGLAGADAVCGLLRKPSANSCSCTCATA